MLIPLAIDEDRKSRVWKKQNNEHTDIGYFPMQTIASKAVAKWLLFFSRIAKV